MHIDALSKWGLRSFSRPCAYFGVHSFRLDNQLSAYVRTSVRAFRVHAHAVFARAPNGYGPTVSTDANVYSVRQTTDRWTEFISRLTIRGKIYIFFFIEKMGIRQLSFKKKKTRLRSRKALGQIVLISIFTKVLHCYLITRIKKYTLLIKKIM